MKKKFVKLNNNDNNLSLGNIIRYIKLEADNKVLATQTEIFCAIFDIEDANDSTVNNYCIGYRSIGNEYKDIYINYKKNSNQYILFNTIINIISIMEGKINIDIENELDFINNNKHLSNLLFNLYNLAKNDNDINHEFINTLKNNINNNNLYEATKDILFYAILEKKQPVYVDNIVKKSIETIINNTNISINDLENFLNAEFMDGINYTYKIKKMANDNNPYALFSLAMMEYNGEMIGYTRYNRCYEYLKKAASCGHPRANFMIAHLIYNSKIGSKTNDDLNLAWTHLVIAKEAGSVAAINTMGLAYLNGYVPNEDKNIKKAFDLFKEAANYNYTYAYNNLGFIYENKKEYKKAFEYYLESANLSESWACNKIGYFYLNGIGTQKDLKKAFEYFNLGIDSPIKIQCLWNKYNLAKYFYLNGCYEANIEINVEKSISLLEDICYDLIEASILLFYIAIKNKDLDKILYYKSIIENNDDFNDIIKNEIENKMKLISISKINIDNIINMIK